MEEKEDYKKQYQPEPGSSDINWLDVWKKSIESVETKYRTSINTMTREEILREGQADPPAKDPYPTSSAEEVIKHELHLHYIRENYDARTAEQKECWISEEDWMNMPEVLKLKDELKRSMK